MKRYIPVLTVLALAAGSAYAADKKGFDALDRNNDGYVTRAEAAGNSRVLKGFDVADKNNDGKLSRTEYMSSVTKRKVRNVANRPSDPDPGFNALDKNNDGYITRAEARGNPYLKKFFDRADANNDGKVNRAEYVAQMAKKDVKTGAAKVGNLPDRSSTWPDRTAAIQ
jgi:Ca2+-binding EF-hand superfamily protein